MLSSELLEELARRWREQGVMIASELRPGLSDEEMDELTAPLGIRLPREARRWWGWHDGAPVKDSAMVAAWHMTPAHGFLSLGQSIDEYRRIRPIAGMLSAEYEWPTTWLPLGRGRDPIAVDCGVEFGDPVPVYSFGFDQLTRYDEPDARSIGELVLVWIKAIDCGAWSYDRDAQRWDYDLTKLPAELQSSGLV